MENNIDKGLIENEQESFSLQDEKEKLLAAADMETAPGTVGSAESQGDLVVS